MILEVTAKSYTTSYLNGGVVTQPNTVTYTTGKVYKGSYNLTELSYYGSPHQVWNLPNDDNFTLGDRRSAVYAKFVEQAFGGSESFSGPPQPLPQLKRGNKVSAGAGWTVVRVPGSWDRHDEAGSAIKVLLKKAPNGSRRSYLILHQRRTMEFSWTNWFQFGESETVGTGSVTFSNTEDGGLKVDLDAGTLSQGVAKKVGNALEIIPQRPEEETADTITLLPVELMQPKLDQNGEVVLDTDGYAALENVTSIRFSRWRKAFADEQGTLDGTHPGNDPDRFYIRVNGLPANVTKLKIEVAGIGEAVVNGAITSPGTDDANEVQIVDHGGALGRASDAMILVSDGEDDKLVAGSQDDQNGDLSHLGDFSSTITITLPELNNAQFTTKAMPPKGKIRVYPVFISLDQTGPAGDFQNKINLQFAKGREVYRQWGVLLGNEAAGGLRIFPVNSNLYWNSMDNEVVEYSEAQDLVAAIEGDTQNPVPQNAIIAVYVPSSISTPDAGGGTSVKRAYHIPGTRYIIIGTISEALTLSHEIGHVFLGANHEPRTSTIRLMKSAGTINDGDANTHSKRIYFMNEQTILSSNLPSYEKY